MNQQRAVTTAANISRQPFRGWRMVGLGFIAVNLALGTTFGAFGVLLAPVAAELGATRAEASLGIALILLLMGLAGPVLGWALARVSIRAVMSCGAVLMAFGFLLASHASNFPLFLLGYSLIGGAGCALLSIIPASTLVTNWFVSRRGLAMGLICVPLLVALAPPAVAWVIEWQGWRITLSGLAVLMLLVVPLLQLIVDRPEQIGQIALGSADIDPAAAFDGAMAPSTAASGALWRSGHFWGLIVGGGLLTCGGIVIVSHMVPFAMGHGATPTAAALLLTINGSCGMAGALAFGWIADRLGPRITVGMNGVAQAVLWSLMLAFPSYGMIAASLVGIGLCSGGLQPAFAALLGSTYGRDAFAMALGLASMLMLPFTFAAAPVAGAIFDATGAYTSAFLLQIGCFVAGAAILLVGFRNQPR